MHSKGLTKYSKWLSGVLNVFSTYLLDKCDEVIGVPQVQLGKDLRPVEGHERRV